MDPKFKPFVRQELKKLGENMRSMHSHQNKTYADATREKWGPGGSKASKAGRKTVKFAQEATGEENRANERTNDRKSEEVERSKRSTPAERKGAGGTETEEKHPDVKIEQHNEDAERGRASGEGLDDENKKDGQGASGNQQRDRGGKDNAARRRTGSAKTRKKKVKHQSNAARLENKGNGDARLESSDGRESSGATPKAAGGEAVAGERS